LAIFSEFVFFQHTTKAYRNRTGVWKIAGRAAAAGFFETRRRRIKFSVGAPNAAVVENLWSPPA